MKKIQEDVAEKLEVLGIPIQILPQDCFPPGVIGVMAVMDEHGQLDHRKSVVIKEGCE